MAEYTGPFHGLGMDARQGRDLERAGYHSDAEVMAASDEDLTNIVGEEGVKRIRGTSGTSSLKLTQAQRDALGKAGYVIADDMRNATDDDLRNVEGIGDVTLQHIRDSVGSVEVDSGNAEGV